MIPSSNLEHELDVAQVAAREAAQKILEVRTAALENPEQKPDDQGPVTVADLAADAVIRKHLEHAFPDDLVITEETWVTGTEIASAERSWIIDPLDGTSDFIKGGDDYAVMIGLCIGGIPRVGVVCQPPTGILWRAIAVGDVEREHSPEDLPAGLKTRCERVNADNSVVQLNIAARPLPATGARFALSRNHKSPLADYITGNMGAKIVRKGSVGLKVAMILDDEADAYLSGSSQIKVWDTAGPAALLHAAGGPLMTSLAGDSLHWSGKAAHGEGIRALLPAAQDHFGDAFVQLVDRYRKNFRKKS